ncbi:MAG TPA: methionyl-tRNA formyltransferase, partial [Dissulfurispiraceae bacterium]
MALVFFGTPQFAVPTLRVLAEEKEDVVLVVTQPDKVKGRGHVLSSPPVKEFAAAKGIRTIQPAKIRNEDFSRDLRAINPEFIVVVAYGKILPEEVLSIPGRGCVNVHASLLPKYRGAAPIQWSLIRGERETGVTTMLMDEGMDTGDILMQETLVIGEDDNAATLSEKLSELGAKTLIRTLAGIREGRVRPVPQTGEATYAPPLRKGDGKIDWNRGAKELFDFVRGMSPWPSAFCSLGNETIKILKVKPLEGKGTPGRIERASKGELVVGTGSGLLGIEELQPQGKKAMSAQAFLAGR